MSENNKSYRIRTNVGEDTFVSVNLEQEYDAFDILSLSIKSADVYNLHDSNYGVVVGRVIANNGFGIPNAKISIFIQSEADDNEEMSYIYPFMSTGSKNSEGVRYNLLPDEEVDKCHQVVGTFPNKRYLLSNDVLLEVFEKYYKYTVRTNNAGDYMICGVPTGSQQIHMDLDLSDCGPLSQRPRDFVYKGYTVEQFENPNMFKTGTEYSELSQIFTQDQSIYVYPFWGNEGEGRTVGITRADINVSFRFEPTCVFMGCVAGDNASNGFSKKCIPTENMGNMDELTTGEGTIEMIRKTYDGKVEEFQVRGTELINSDGIWCYQIPMNLDYMITDEYGNMVPTDDPEKGIPTRTRVRFRISMQDMEEANNNFFRAKALVPHNPQNTSGVTHEDYDYEFGTYTKEESFRDLFWNNVYSVKSYIPRIQKKKVRGWKTKNFSGIKHCQDFGGNNPIPYNNIRIELPFMFKVICLIAKSFIKIVGVVNYVVSALGNMLADIGNTWIPSGFKVSKWKLKWKKWYPFKTLYKQALRLKMTVIDEGLCPDLENWYFAPMFKSNLWTSADPPDGMARYNLLSQTLKGISVDDDETSIDDQNQDPEDEAICLTTDTSYLISCMEMNLAQEYKVINFDFYNDWINGLIYFPRWMRFVRPKKKFFGITFARAKVKGCMDNNAVFAKSRRYTQMCSLSYRAQKSDLVDNAYTFSKVSTKLSSSKAVIKSNNLHKKGGLLQTAIFGHNGGICHDKETMLGQHVYYLKPCEWLLDSSPKNRKVNLYATDIILLGSLNDCDLNGIPQAFKHLPSSSYIMPSNIALTNMETNGTIYTHGNSSTICSPRNQTTTSTDSSVLMRPAGTVNIQNSGLGRELAAYSGASSNYDVVYNDPSDTIAMTEAAGIAWNYTGPQQGGIDKKKLYYPGGHFLGLSCVNSQTNVKSCINLERICELGATMSQRKEDVRANIDGKLEYVYTVPTGLISGDDIIDNDARVMFATMNQRRLIADKINPFTGYKMYGFSYVHPTNFGGELSNYTGGVPYNCPASEVTSDEALVKYGISRSYEREDYDSTEKAWTFRKTIENTSVDYYRFRLGIDFDSLSPNNTEHMRHFAKGAGVFQYLPQYENSFYFYFGMHDGATALDEFNKEFFSQCETSDLKKKEPSLDISVGEFQLCMSGRPDGGPSSEVRFEINEMKQPYIYTIIHQTGTTVASSGVSSSSTIVERLERENYRISIRDANDMEITATFSVGRDVIGGTVVAHSFNTSGETLVRTDDNKNMFYGGYIEGEGLVVNGYTGTTWFVAVKDKANPYDIERGVVSSVANILGDAPTTRLRETDDEVLLGVMAKRVYDCATDSMVPCTVLRGSVNAVPTRPDFIQICENPQQSVDDGVCLFNDYCDACSDACSCDGDVPVIDPPTPETTYIEQIEDGKATIYVSSANVVYDLYIKIDNENCGIQYIYVDTVTVNGASSCDLSIGDLEKVYFSEEYLTVSGQTDNWWTKYADDNASEFNQNAKAWAIRRAIIDSNNSANTFSSDVAAVNGSKMLWGTPQKLIMTTAATLESQYYYDELSVMPFTSEHEDDYIGYTLDDDVSYLPTYGISEHNISVFNYDALSYAGEVVTGEFAAIVSGDTGSTFKVCNLISGKEDRIKNNHGGIFKALPEGIVIPVRFVVSDGVAKIYHYGDIGDSEFGEYENGVVYPALNYPVIQRPFKVHANYFEIVGKRIYGDAIDGVTDFELVSKEKLGCRVEGYIKNGITYKKYIGKDSFIPMFTKIKSDGSYDDTRLSRDVDDLHGVSPSYTSDLEIAFSSGAMVGNTPDDFGYGIYEGYPAYLDSNGNYLPVKDYDEQPEIGRVSEFMGQVEYAALDYNATFYDDIFYNFEEGESGKEIYAFEGEGSSDEGVRYYLYWPQYIESPHSAGTTHTSDHRHIEYPRYVRTVPTSDQWRAEDVFIFISGYYTAAAAAMCPANVEGEDVGVYFNFWKNSKDGYWYGKFVANFYYNNPEDPGNYILSACTERGDRLTEGRHNNDIDWILARDNDGGCFGGKIKFHAMKIITDAQCTKITNSATTYDENRSYTRNTKVRLAGYDGSDIFAKQPVLAKNYFSACCIVGVAEYVGDERSKGTHYKIYTNPVPKSSVKIKKLRVSPTSRQINYISTSVTFTIQASSEVFNCTATIIEGASYSYFLPYNQGAHTESAFTGSSAYTFQVHIDANSYAYSRNVAIRVTSPTYQGTSANVTIIQAGRPSSGGGNGGGGSHVVPVEPVDPIHCTSDGLCDFDRPCTGGYHDVL